MSDMTETMSIEEKVRVLSTMTTRDHAGRHFTERYKDDILEQLEAEELIEICRPVHEPTGIDYDCGYWTMHVTEEGVDLVQAYPEYWDQD